MKTRTAQFGSKRAVFFATILGGAALAGAAQTNDDFQDALIVSGSESSLVSSNVLATAEAGEPSHGGPYSAAGKSLWWSYSPSANATVTFSTMGSNFDTVLAVYTGAGLQTLTTVAASDDIDDDNSCSAVNLDVLAGTTYYIAVDGWLARSGDMVLSHSTLSTAVPGPANDFFANAQPLAGNAGNLSATNVGASKEVGEPEHASVFGGRSVWYNYTAQADGNISIDTVGSTFNSMLAVYTGTSVDSLTLVASNRNPSSGFWSVVNFAGTAGTVYRVAVDGFDQQCGPFNLAYNGPVAPAPVVTATSGLVGSWVAEPLQKLNRTKNGTQSQLKAKLAVRNLSPLATSHTAINFYSSADTVLDAADTAIGTGQLKALKPGEKASARLRVTLPPNSSASGLYIIAGVEDALLGGSNALTTSAPLQ